MTGLILIALGVVFASRPGIGALTIAEVFGLFNLVWGVSTLVIAANIRKADKNTRPDMPRHASLQP